MDKPRRKPYDLVIRERDKKCRAERDGKPLTGWLKDGMKVFETMNKKEPI